MSPGTFCNIFLIYLEVLCSFSPISGCWCKCR